VELQQAGERVGVFRLDRVDVAERDL